MQLDAHTWVPSEKVQVNLQMGMGKGVGAHIILYQPGVNIWCSF